jgi:hypothetical protein
VESALNKRAESDDAELATANSKLAASLQRMKSLPKGSGALKMEENRAMQAMRDVRTCQQQLAASRARHQMTKKAARSVADAEAVASMAAAIRTASAVEVIDVSEDVRLMQERSRQLERIMAREFGASSDIDEDELASQLAELSAAGYDAEPAALPPLPPVPSHETPPPSKQLPLHSK